MGRNAHIVSNRSETPLEIKRAMVTKDVTDEINGIVNSGNFLPT